MPPSLVLFDLDGTLVDSLLDLTDAVNHMLHAFGRSPLKPDQVRQLVGKGARNLIQRALAGSSAGEIDRGLALFTAYNTEHIADKSRLYPGAASMLERLSGAGIRMALVSNKPEPLTRLIMRTLAADRFFELIAGGETFPEMKPSPLPLLRTVELLGVEPAAAVMVGDSSNDFLAGRAAGIATIGCSWGYGQPGDLNGADCRVDSCAELADLLIKGAG